MRRFAKFAAMGAVAAIVLSGCGQDHTKTPTSTPGATFTDAVATTTTAAWSTAPVIVVHHPAVPPVPVITGVRFAGHPEDGYDRFVLDISGGLPGYTARYVTEVRTDGSDQPVKVPGKAFLLLVFTPAQAHTDAGAVTISGVHPITLTALKGWAVAGDFEGHVSVALGLAAKAGYRIGELPGRIYVDVATR
jgi:hypothetical protein